MSAKPAFGTGKNAVPAAPPPSPAPAPAASAMSAISAPGEVVLVRLVAEENCASVTGRRDSSAAAGVGMIEVASAAAASPV